MSDVINGVFGKIKSFFKGIDVEQKMKYGAGVLMLIGGAAIALAASADDSSDISSDVETIEIDEVVDIPDNAIAENKDESSSDDVADEK